jgi:hypothetical protein
MRVHEVDLRDDTGDRDVFVHGEVAETVMRQRRRGHETRHGQAEQAAGSRVTAIGSKSLTIHASPSFAYGSSHYPCRERDVDAGKES